MRTSCSAGYDVKRFVSTCSIHKTAEAALSGPLWHALLTGLYLWGPSLQDAAMVARAGSLAAAAHTAVAGAGRQRAAWRAHLPGQDLHRHSSSLQRTISYTMACKEATNEPLLFC